MAIGDHNQIHTDLTVKQGTRTVDDRPTALNRIREHAATIRAASPTDDPALAKADEMHRRLDLLFSPKVVEDAATPVTR
jgi:hypothetical protein